MSAIRISAKPWRRAGGPMPSGLLRYAGLLLLLTTFYYLSGRLGLLLATPHPNSTPVWPPTGIAIAALAIWGIRLWPAAWLGAFLVSFQLSGDLPSSLGIAAGNSAEAVLGAHLLRRLGGTRAFENSRAFLVFLGAAAAPTSVSAAVGVASLGLAGLAPVSQLGLIGLTWWVGNLMSAWVVVPLLLLAHEAWKRPGPRRRPALARLAEMAALAAAQLGANLLVFGGILPEPYRNAPLAFITLPPLLWGAYRFGRVATSLALLAQTALAAWGTSRGFSQFATQGQSFLLLQMFVATGLVSFLLLAIVVHARDEAEARLRESEHRIDSLVRSVPGIVWESAGDPAGPSHRITYVSEYAERMLGYPIREWLTRADLWKAVVHPDDRGRMAGEAAKALANGVGGVGYFRCVSRDGKVVDVEVRAVVVRDSYGRPTGMRGFVMDVSDRRRAEEKLRSAEDQLRQAQKMEAVGRLAGGMAHDFNNLLTTVNGYSDLVLAQLEEGDPMRGFAEEIRGAGERAAVLTRQLLAFSRKDVVQARVIDVNAVVGELQRMLGRLIGGTIRLRTSLDPALLKVKADPGQVSLIVLNLVVNARDAMAQAGGDLDLSTANVRTSGEEPGFYLKPTPGPCVRLTVKDTGRGMDAGVLDHLFEPFFTTKDRSSGTGLGLSAVYGIVERMGGGIRVESAPGLGSAFHVYFPALAADAGPGFAARAVGLQEGSEDLRRPPA